MANPEAQSMKDKLAPQLPNLRLIDLIFNYFADLSTPAAALWLLVIAGLIYLLFVR